MQNIRTTVKGSILTIEIDTTQNLGPSKSGKTMLVASTQGNQPVKGTEGGDVVIGINAYRRGL